MIAARAISGSSKLSLELPFGGLAYLKSQNPFEHGVNRRVVIPSSKKGHESGRWYVDPNHKLVSLVCSKFLKPLFKWRLGSKRCHPSGDHSFSSMFPFTKPVFLGTRDTFDPQPSASMASMVHKTTQRGPRLFRQ